jgi:hypothetical protein
MDVATDDAAEESPRRSIETKTLKMKKLATTKMLLCSPTCSASPRMTAARTIDATGLPNGAMDGGTSKS